MKAYAVSVLLLLAAPAPAATIMVGSAGDPSRGTVVDLDPSQFTGSGPCGYGGSVIRTVANPGCAVVEKTDPALPDAFGRFDPFEETWIDSQDLSEVSWNFSFSEAFTSLTFALTDAFDQAPDSVLGESFFRLEVGNDEWSIAEREPNGTLHWVTVLFDQPTMTTEMTFFTRLNDGWGVSSASIAVVPIPAAMAQMLLALGALAAFAARRRWLTARQA